MSEDLKAGIRRVFEEAYNRGNLNALDELVAGDYVRIQPPMKTVKGLTAYKQFVEDVRSAYSGLEFRIDEIIVSGETTVVRTTLKGRHTGQAPTLQAPPTGKTVEMTGSLISHWRDGKIVSDYAFNDYLGLLQQFGVIPPPGMFA